MAAQKPHTRSVLLADYTIIGSRVKVVKKKHKARSSSQPGLKRKDGLLKAAVPVRSEPMQIAKRNSLDSPLLRLPGEIRNKIWEYAVGFHHIDIRDQSFGKRWDIKLTHDTHLSHISSIVPSTFVRPTFALPKVCRQVYVETSTMIYKLNSFGFSSHDTFDRWIKNRPIGQRRIITSIAVPFEYYNLYCGGFRKLFCQTFPNIKRIGVHLQVALINQRVIESTWEKARPRKEALEDTKKRIVDYVRGKEGAGVEVVWHHGTTSSLIYEHF